MKKLMASVCAACALSMAGFVGGSAQAETTPFMIGLFSPVQAPSSDYNVKGVALGLLWSTCADLDGLQLSLGANLVTGRGFGAQASVFGGNYCAENYYGAQLAYLGIEICEGKLRGAQGAAFTCYANDGKGLQVSCVNMSHDFTGLQLGIVNTAERLHGVQIGVLNFIRESPLPFFPIVNAHF